MEKLLDFLEKHRWGILATFMIHVAVLLYLQIDTYEYQLNGRGVELMAEVEDEEEIVELTPEQIIMPDKQMQQSFSGEVKNITQNANDKREKSFDNFSRSSTDQKIEQNVKDLEKQYFEELSKSRGGSSGQGIAKNSGSGGSSPSKSTDIKPTKDNTTTNSGGATSENQFKGRTMVRYDLENRNPHNNNDWNIRNPGYTCGGNANGEVVIAIRVNSNGDVVSTRYVSEMSNNANSCMVEQAELYAKKSRFAFSSSAPKLQDGFIYYTFVSKK